MRQNEAQFTAALQMTCVDAHVIGGVERERFGNHHGLHDRAWASAITSDPVDVSGRATGPTARDAHATSKIIRDPPKYLAADPSEKRPAERWRGMNYPGRLQPDPGAALLDLYDTALPQVYGYLLPRCGRRALAEDLTAETFLAAVEAVRKKPPPELSVAWLIGVARHKLADHWRRVAREERGLTVLDGVAQDVTEDPSDERLDALVAREVLATLGAHHRAALTLRYLDGLSVPQVAEHLGRTRQATEALLVRARAAFRNAYADHCSPEKPIPGHRSRKEGHDD